jgi:hypothetical protein
VAGVSYTHDACICNIGIFIKELVHFLACYNLPPLSIPTSPSLHARVPARNRAFHSDSASLKLNAVKTHLIAIKDGLAELTDAELHALIAAANGAPPIAYGQLVWIEGA